jgi:hypothetical protein
MSTKDDQYRDAVESCISSLRVLSTYASGCPNEREGNPCQAARRMFALAQDAFAALDRLDRALNGRIET